MNIFDIFGSFLLDNRIWDLLKFLFDQYLTFGFDFIRSVIL